MSATTPEPPGFAEFLSLVNALPPDQRASFDQLMANAKAGMTVQDAVREYLVANGRQTGRPAFKLS